MLSCMRIIACIILCLMVTPVVQAATVTWTGAIDTNWSTPGNWSTGEPPGTSDTAEFASGGTTVNVDSSYTIGSLLLDSTADMTFSNGTLTIMSGLTMTGSNNFSFASNITLGGDQTWNQSGTGTLTMTGQIDEASVHTSLIKTGTGTIIMGNAALYSPTWSGTTSVEAGVLELNNFASLNSNNIGVPTVIIASGAVLQYDVPSTDGGDNIQGDLVISGDGTLLKTGPGTLYFGDYGPADWELSSNALIDLEQGALVGGNNAQDYWSANLCPLYIAAGAGFFGVEANVVVDALTGSGSFSGSYHGYGYTAETIGVSGGSGTFSGTMSDNGTGNGPMNLIKAGAGSQWLTGTLTYTGTTTITGGALVIDGNGTAAIGGLEVQSGATLGGTGSLGGVVTVDSGAALSPGDGSPGTFTLCAASTTALALSSGSTTTFALGSTSDQIACTGANSIVTIGGSLVITNSGGLATGVYQLISFTGTTSSGTFSNVTMPIGYTAMVSIDNVTTHAVLLTVVQENVWNGTTSTDWNDASNWSLDQVPDSTDDIQIGDGVGTYYTSPSVTGAGGLCHSLTFYTSASTVGAGGGSLTIGPGGINAMVNGSEISCPVALGADQTWSALGSATLTISGAISGAYALTTSGTGTMSMSGANSYTQGTTVSQGQLTLTGAAFSTTAGTYTIAAGAVMGIAGSTAMASGTTTITGAGTLCLISGANFQNTSNAGEHLAVALSTGGLFDIQSGAFMLNGGWQAIDWSSNLGSFQVDGAFDLWDGNAITADALTGSGSINKSFSFGTQDISVGVNNGSGTFSGTIGNTETINLTKEGSGTQTITGMNTYTGTTTVTDGTLALGTGGSLGPTAISVASGASFSAIPGGGSVSAGATGAGSAGATLTLTSGSTYSMVDGAIDTFNLQQNGSFAGPALTISGATLDFDVNSSGADSLACTGSASVSGINSISITGIGSSLTTGASYNLITASGGLNGGTWQFSGGGTVAAVTTGSTTYQVSLSSSATAVTLLVCPALAITSRQTQDLNANGFLDHILVTTTQNLNNSFAGLMVTVAGYTVDHCAAGPSPTSFYIVLDEGGIPDTGATPAVQITANTSLAAYPGNQLLPTDVSPVTSTDEAPPVLMSSNWTDGGAGGVSAGDIVTLTFSEPVTTSGMVVSDLGLPVTSDSLSTTTISNQVDTTTITMTLAGTPRLTPGGIYSSGSLSAGEPTGINLADNSHIQDQVGLPGVVGSASSAVDLGPTTNLISINWVSGSDPMTWALGAVSLGTIANTISSGLNLTIANVGNCNLNLTVTSAAGSPSNWLPGASAGLNTYMMLADSTGASTSAPSSPASYGLSLTTSQQSLVSGLLTGATTPFALYVQLPTTISSSAGVPQSVAITITANLPP